MLLSGALFALFMAGFWLYCLTDAILTPPSECRGLPKPGWIAIIALTFIGGAIAWLILRPGVRGSATGPTASTGPTAPMPRLDAGNSADDGPFRGERWTAADDAVARHPAGRAMAADAARATPKGPDDDPDFLRALDRAIHGNSQAGDEL